MSDDKKSLGTAQLRLLTVIEVLAGHEVFGSRLKDIAAAVKAGESTVLRDLRTLAEGGWAMQDENGLWRLDTKLVQIANHFAWGITAATHKLSEVKQRYTRTPT